MAEEEKIKKDPNDVDEVRADETSEEKSSSKNSRWHKFLTWYKENKKKSVPLTVLLVVVLLASIPWSRYHATGLVLKNDFSLKITDSAAGTPVSGAAVSIGNVSAITDANGKATLHNLSVGNHTVQVYKKYYKNSKATILVPIFKQKTTPSIGFVATGRQAKVVVTNLINHSKLEGVDIKVSDTSAKTDKTGTATVVLPVGTTSAKATLSLNNYNTKTYDVKVSNDKIEENDFALTPAGKVYFLSKLSGKIDVVKTDLDGTSRHTVLAGTGKEEDRGTVLLASRDWKFLALLSHREAAAAKLYLIDTSDDSLTTIDGAAGVTVSPVGWNEHNFVYTIDRQNVALWQPNRQALKSYSAETNKITLLDQTKGEGTSQYDNRYESFGSIYQKDSSVIYEKYWNDSYYYDSAINGKVAGIYSISNSGSSAKALKTFEYSSGQSTYINSIPYEANQVYYQITEKSAAPSYYVYQNGKVTAKNDIKDDFDKYSQQGATTYLQSPSSNNTFWSESRDGKNTLFIGDGDGENGKQIATLSDYQTYGWFTDDYLLMSKGGSELYIASKQGFSKDSEALKISDYHKPTQNFYGYGGGYGGI
jgi:hypothetical protein